MSLRRVLTLVACAGLAGCTSTVAGEPARTSGDGNTAAAVLGDFATYDPCGLVDPAVFGAADLLDRRSFESCALRAGGASVSVGGLGVPAGRDVQRVADLDGGWWIAQVFRGSSSCRQSLVFPDDVLLHVTVTGREGDDLCAVAEKGVRMVADRLRAAPAEHDEYPEDSLALRDPCDMATGDVVHALPAYPKATRTPAPAGHTCSWSQAGDDEATTLDVRFTIGAPPTAAGDDEERDVAGRPTVVSRYEGESGAVMCTVSTGHIRSDLSPQQRPNTVEVAEVETYVPAGGETGCDSALTVAEEVWEQLPG